MDQSDARDMHGREAGQAKDDGQAGAARPIRTAQIFERGREVWQDARGLASTVEEAFDEIQEYLREQVDARPYVALSAAAGVGYVLGGGLPSRVTRLLVGWGSRLALTMAVQRLTAPSGVATAPSNPS